MHAPGYTVASGLAPLVSSQRVVFSAVVCNSLPGHSSRLICLSLFISVMCFCGVWCMCVSPQMHARLHQYISWECVHGSPGHIYLSKKKYIYKTLGLFFCIVA